MTPPQVPASFEVCPSCSQRTASQFFRVVRKTRLCLLCAQRAEKGDACVRAQIEDRRLHGGSGWLWQHILYVVYATIGGTLLRLGILHLLHSR